MDTHHVLHEMERQVPQESATEKKQSRLDRLCEQLFERRDLIAAGRIQLIDLGQMRRTMSDLRWSQAQKRIHTICEGAIAQYLDKKDLHICYRNESYILLIAATAPGEGERKAALIRAEIGRRLAIENIESIGIVASPARPQPAIIDVATMAREGNATNLDLGVDGSVLPSGAVHYLPVWDRVHNRLIAHLCLAKGAGGVNAFAAHEAFYESCRASSRAAVDMALLNGIIQWMQDSPEKLVRFGLICPVHYETLQRTESCERYRVLCQRIQGRMKSHMLFMVLNLPPAAPWTILSQSVAPLKTYGRILCGHLQQPETTDIAMLRLAGFDTIGVTLSPPGSGQRFNLREFVARAGRNMITKTFALGLDDPFSATEACDAGVRYLGGQAVHVPLADPAIRPDFSKYLRAAPQAGTGHAI